MPCAPGFSAPPPVQVPYGSKSLYFIPLFMDLESGFCWMLCDWDLLASYYSKLL